MFHLVHETWMKTSLPPIPTTKYLKLFSRRRWGTRLKGTGCSWTTPLPFPPHPHSPYPLPDSKLTSTRLAFKFCNHAAGLHFKIFLKFIKYLVKYNRYMQCFVILGGFFAHRPTSSLREFRGTYETYSNSNSESAYLQLREHLRQYHYRFFKPCSSLVKLGSEFCIFIASLDKIMT